MSEYQNIKLVALSILNLSKDAVHIYIGFIFLFISLFIFKKFSHSYKLLMLGFCFSVAMEVLDLKDDLLSLGYFRWSASLHDIINTNLLPLLVVSYLYLLNGRRFAAKAKIQ